MAKVKTLVDFHDLTNIDPKTGFPKLVPAGTTLDIDRDRQAELAARRIVPKPGEVVEEAQPATAGSK
ncbi:hypothetical protein HY78_01005 [Rhizorhabdus wittichii DC-6]|nr:hypothetical protein HY78_01005 [Rhizorhabdus wittichii DC-6]